MSEQTPYGTVTEEFIAALRDIASADHVVTDSFDLEKYAKDETEDLYFPPDVVVKPNTTEQVAAIVKLCDEKNVPVTPRGGGTGLSGGALPVHAGVCIAFERMNRILEIDMENMMAVVQPGVITEELHRAVEDVGLMYPPDPASRGSCTIGGNIAECAGGPRAVKYGVTKDYVCGLEAVLPNGKVIRTGGKLVKNVTGYNLTQLLVGSEGTLAIVTEATLRLIPLPTYRRTLLVPFPSMEAAAIALNKIMMNRIIPSAADFMSRLAVQTAEKKLDRKFPNSDAGALLIFEVDGADLDIVQRDAERIGTICLENEATDALLAESTEKQNLIWEMRRAVGEAVKSISIYKEEDTVVPRARLPELMRILNDISARYEITIISYGHAGDGNIHANIIKGDMPDDKWENTLPPAIREIHRQVVRLGGMISGEHGIGYSQRPYLPIALSSEEISLMRGIKKVFDPKNILNPNKIFPDEP